MDLKPEKIDKHIKLPKDLVEKVKERMPYLNLTDVIVIALTEYISK